MIVLSLMTEFNVQCSVFTAVPSGFGAPEKLRCWLRLECTGQVTAAA